MRERICYWQRHIIGTTKRHTIKIFSTRNLKIQEGIKSNQRGNVGQNINEYRIYKTVMIIPGVIK